VKLFISYARVDMPLCKQIVERLSHAHEVWYDSRVFAGQDWWKEILSRVEWCEGFVYLLSPESVKSEYCQQECEIALKSGKHFFPVLIQAKTEIPPHIARIQYANLSEGMEDFYVLLNAITVAEREIHAKPISAAILPVVAQPGQTVTPDTVFDDATEALDKGEFDRAVFILKQALENGAIGRRARMIEAMLAKAETDLNLQTYLREAEREYRPIAKLVKVERTRAIGCREFESFCEEFPDYDPDNLSAICGKPQIVLPPPPDVSAILPPPFEWRYIPAGKVTLEYGEWQLVNDSLKYQVTSRKDFEVPAFHMAKYPITSAQFEVFVKAKDGYRDACWWDYSDEAKAWRAENAQPEKSTFDGGDCPRTDVSWYEAVAFCQWLDPRTGSKGITLPTEQQWQRAAQGDDGRAYPWGNDFDKNCCNTRESGIGRTTPVTRYLNGASPFKVVDMAGNVWEWCRTTREGDSIGLIGGSSRALRGGSWVNDQDVSRAVYRSSNRPALRNLNVGFRLVVSPPIPHR
jgi:formylglycine-generating enzyme required for sulfatase activity